MNEPQLARSLAIFSVGLGLAEVLAPRKVARLIGISEDHERTLQLLGLREIASGLGILQGNPGHFLWARVAGDAMDLGLLATVRQDRRSDPQRVGWSMLAVAGVAALDLVASVLHSRSPEDPGWRVAGPEDYRRGILPDTPQALRTCCDDAMARYQSGHLAESMRR